jgi:molybdopterin/thiamine biosynthesis adenylyltransferase
MSHIVQVGAGSGGMVVLDLVGRDQRVTALTLIEPDVYKPHNTVRHYFGVAAAGRAKAELAKQWLSALRPELEVRMLQCDVMDPARQEEIESAIATADLGVCAVDQEPAKYHWDALMRKHGKPWTLGEVLSGGIGGFVHWFAPGGPCYGCVASHLQRSLEVEKPPAPDYTQPGGVVHEVTIPASKAAIHTIAGLHAVLTLNLLADRANFQPGFTTMLLTLQRVPDVFAEAFRTHRFSIARSPDCLICCSEPSSTARPEELDAALDQALARLGEIADNEALTEDDDSRKAAKARRNKADQ